MRTQADLWLGFESHELLRFAQEAGLSGGHVTRVPAPRSGPDAHLPWHAMVAIKNGTSPTMSAGRPHKSPHKKRDERR
jgi:hypothetical protein